MPQRKDYLLDQLREFFDAISKIAGWVKEGELDRAEREIDALSAEAAIGELLRAGEGSVVPEHTYQVWKFQTELLLLRIRVYEARQTDVVALRWRAASALQKLIALRPDVYDIELQEQLRGLAFDPSEIKDKTLLAGGLSGSAVYKIIVGGKPYVLKIDKTQGKGAAENLKQAADAGIAPPLYYQDTVEGISISGFVESRPLRAALPPDQIPGQLAEVIKKIHALPAPAGGQDVWVTVDGLIAEFRGVGMLSGPVFDECFAGYEKIKRIYPQDVERVFSHNDLNPANVLSDGSRVWVIDWDVAGSNDRFVDLAVAANFFIYTPGHEAALLDAYFDGRAGEVEKARFMLMRAVVRIVYALLMFRLAFRQKPVDFVHDPGMEGITLQAFGAMMATGQLSLGSYEGQLMYGKALVNEAVRQMGMQKKAPGL